MALATCLVVGSCKYCMRIQEITSIKPRKPLTPAQARVSALKQNVQRSKDQLNAERERQRKQRDNERKQKQIQQRNKALSAI